MIGKIADHSVILVAAILTACGVLLAFLPWEALSPPPQAAAKPAKAIVFVDMATSKLDAGRSPK
jgi:hypothetical protein